MVIFNDLLNYLQSCIIYLNKMLESSSEVT